MDQLLLIIVVFVTVSCMAWSAIALVQHLSEPGKRKLQQRLTADASIGFESNTARSLLLQQQTTGLPAMLADRQAVQRMQNWLSQGLPRMPLSRFLIVLAVLALILGAMATMLAGSAIAGVAGAIIGASAPCLLVSSRRKSRRRLLNAQLPESLDFLSRILRSGQSFSTGLQMMADELPQPIAAEFRRVNDQHSLGQSIEQGLREVALRVGSTDFSFFATAVIIQRQSGGDLAEVLHNISDMVRKRLRLAQSVKAKTAEGRFTGLIMVAFPAVMFAITYFIDPKRGDVMLSTSMGRIFLGVALFLMALGSYLIKRITTVKV